jgi:hypothetical protein
MIKLKVNFEVQTYYPAFRRDRVNQPGYTKDYGTGMSDLNGYSEGGYSDYFHQPGEYGGTSSFYNTSIYYEFRSIRWIKRDGYFVEPKRSKWFNNILKARANNRNNNI